MPYKDPEARRANDRQRRRLYYAKNKARILATQKTAEIRARKAELQRKYRTRRTKEFYRNEWLKLQRDKELQAGRLRPDTCDICGTTEDKIVFDHCHKHGHFRGWICNRCNKILGLVKDNPRMLIQLAAYLQRTINTSPQLALPGV